jgi:hypothetical protein
MRNRPGRIFYMLDFKGLDSDFIREYCEDRLDNKEYIERIVQITETFSAFNFDMLKALVEEMNRYNEPPQEAMKMLNAKPEYSEECKYKVHLHVDGSLVEQEDINDEEWRGNPLTKQVRINYKVYVKDDNGDEDYNWRQANFNTDNLKKIEGGGTRFMFENERGAQAMLVKVKNNTYNVWDAL